MLYHIKPLELLVPLVFLASIGHQSFFSGHFIFLAKSKLTQQIMAPLSTKAMVFVLFPPSIGWRVIGMVIPHLMVVSFSRDESEEVSLSDLLVVSSRHS